MKSSGNRLMISVVLSMVVGCAPKPILMDQTVRDSLSGIREIKVLQYLPPELAVPSGGNPMPLVGTSIGGAIGGAVGAIGGLTTQPSPPEINDPIIQVKDGFLPSVQRTFPKASMSEIANPRQDDDLEKLGREFGQGLLLDLKTIRWAILTKVGQGDHYISYRGRARLVQLPEQKVIWQGVCDLEERDAENMRHRTEFEENNGALLKEVLTKLATICSVELTKQLAAIK